MATSISYIHSKVPEKNGPTDPSLLSSLRPGYWCFVVDGTFDGPSVDYCVYRACKLGVRLSRYVPMGENPLHTTGPVLKQHRRQPAMWLRKPERSV